MDEKAELPDLETGKERLDSARSFRLEKDELGLCNIPEGALWGIRTQRALDNLSVSGIRLSNYPGLIEALIQVKKACAEANSRTGALTGDQALLLSAACDELTTGKYLENFPVDVYGGGGGISINVNINEVIANLGNLSVGSSPGSYTPLDPKKHVNCSQSTADVCSTAFRLSILEASSVLDLRLENLFFELERLSSRYASTRTLARTCLQDAMPVTFDTLFGAYATATARSRSFLSQCREALLQVNLGGTVLGTGDGASRAYRECVIGILSDLISTPLRAKDNFCDAAQNVDDLVRMSGELERLAGFLIKLSKDLRLLSSGPKGGFGELHLPKVMEGSSFFSTKNNPIIPETMIISCLRVIGLHRAATGVIEHGELNLNVFESLAVFCILDQIRILEASLDNFCKNCLSGLDVDQVRCEEIVSLHLH